MNTRRLLVFFLIFVLMNIGPLTSVEVHHQNSVRLSAADLYELSSDTPVVNLTFYSNWNSTPTEVKSGDRLEGDRIILRATWTPVSIIDNCEITVNATAIPKTISNKSSGNIVEINTRALANNLTCRINATAMFTNGSSVTRIFENVFIGNFFPPHVTVISPNGGEYWPSIHNITWSAWDLNEDEELTFEVLLSSDGAKSFQLLAKDLTQMWLLWNFSAFTRLDTYIVEVRVFDGIYMSFDRSNSTFTAGSVLTDTTTTIPPNGFPIDPVMLFVVLMIASSGMMALLVYIAAKRWF